MLAKHRLDRASGLLQLRLQDVRDHRQAPAAPGTGARACFHLRDRFEAVFLDLETDRLGRNVVARTDLRLMGQSPRARAGPAEPELVERLGQDGPRSRE